MTTQCASVICVLVPQQILTDDTIWHFMPPKERCSSIFPNTTIEDLLIVNQINGKNSSVYTVLHVSLKSMMN